MTCLQEIREMKKEIKWNHNNPISQNQNVGNPPNVMDLVWIQFWMNQVQRDTWNKKDIFNVEWVLDGAKNLLIVSVVIMVLW